MRIRAAIVGDLEKMMRQELEAAGHGVLKGVEETATRTRDRLREQVTTAGLGDNVAKAWKQKLYPNQVLDAAAVVFSKAAKIIHAFDAGATIVPQAGHRLLAIPTPEAFKHFGMPVGGGLGVRGRNLRRRLSPANWPNSMGKLRFVARSRPPYLLVVDNVQVNAAGRITGARRLKREKIQAGRTVVMFWLVPRVRISKRLDIERVFRQAERELPEAILRHYTRAAGDTGGTEG